MGAANTKSRIGAFASRKDERVKLLQYAKSSPDGLELNLWNLASLWSHIPLPEISELFHQFTQTSTLSALHLITALVLQSTDLSPSEKAQNLLQFFDWNDNGNLASADLLLILTVGADILKADKSTLSSLVDSAFPTKVQAISTLTSWAVAGHFKKSGR